MTGSTEPGWTITRQQLTEALLTLEWTSVVHDSSDRLADAILAQLTPDSIPQAATEAAAEAILNAPYPKVGEGTARNFATAALAAAVPLIRAGERQRIIGRLGNALWALDQARYDVPPRCDGSLVSRTRFVADLLTGDVAASGGACCDRRAGSGVRRHV